MSGRLAAFLALTAFYGAFLGTLALLTLQASGQVGH